MSAGLHTLTASPQPGPLVPTPVLHLSRASWLAAAGMDPCDDSMADTVGQERTVTPDPGYCTPTESHLSRARLSMSHAQSHPRHW